MGKMINKDIKKRILQISYEKRLSHLGSCLTAVDIIDEIYKQKKVDEKFILSSGHAGLALYCVSEHHYLYRYSHCPVHGYDIKNLCNAFDAEKIFDHHGVHPDRCEECHLDCSTGSLGQGLPIAVGMALANRKKNVYCLVSDGECSEGSIWEALRIAGEQNLHNLKIYLNFNKWGAYKEIPYSPIETNTPEAFPFFDVNIKYTNMDGWPKWLWNQAGHYAIMSYDQYQEALSCLQ